MKKIIEIHASSLRQSACSRQVYLNTVLGLGSNLVFNDTHFGSCVHRFIETYYRTLATPDYKDAEALAHLAAQGMFRAASLEDTWKVRKGAEYLDISKLTITCSAWVQEFKDEEWEVLSVGGKPLVEITFATVLYKDDDLEILLCGTIDRIVKHRRSNLYCVRDWKTTRSYSESYFARYRLDPQLLTYHRAVRELAKIHPESVFAEVAAQEFATAIDGVFLSSSKAVSFTSSEVQIFKQRTIDEYDTLLNDYVQKLVTPDYLGLPPREGMLNGACNTTYGGCPWFTACASPDDRAFEFIVGQNFSAKYINKTKE